MFRIPGSLTEIRKWKEKFDQAEASKKRKPVKMKNVHDACLVAGIIKYYFRTLEDPIVPSGAPVCHRGCVVLPRVCSVARASPCL